MIKLAEHWSLMYKILKVFVFFIATTTIIHGEKIEVLAKEINATETTVESTSGVIVYYQSAVMRADEAYYDKTTQILKLRGNIQSLGYQNTKEQAKEIVIHTQNDEVHFDTLFLTNENDIWLFTQKAIKKGDIYTLGNTVLSSCAIDSPLWKIVFKRSIYDEKKQYMKLYGAKLYMWGVPIFYMPYWAMPTAKNRRTGFLFPYVGYGAKEGFLYEQPFFFAPATNWDIEFNPQIRTSRGFGGYATLRFADSRYSKGELRGGFFKDFKKFQNRYNIKNNTHYGIEFLYDSKKILERVFGLKINDGLYANITYLNDIDYLELQRNRLSNFTLTPLQESRVNYFAHNDNYFGGLYTKYFIDTRKTNNDTTLQILPALQLHRYLRPVVWNSFTYSGDLYLVNLFRKDGLRLRRSEIKIPFEYSTSLFGDFLRLSLQESLYHTKLFFDNYTTGEDAFSYFSTLHQAKIFSDLTKRYSKFIHVIHPALVYTKPGNEQQSPLKFEELDATRRSLFSVGLPEETMELKFAHYLYKDSTKLKFFQRLSQIYYLQRVNHWGDFSSEMGYNGKNFKLYQDLVYSQEHNKIRSSAHRVTWSTKKHHLSLSHTYKKEFLGEDLDVSLANDININLRYNWSPQVTWYAGASYNLKENYSTQWRFGGAYKKDCWSITAALAKNTSPILSSSGASFVDNTAFYVQFNFIPFATVGSQNLFP